jgi:hypothetical protein
MAYTMGMWEETESVVVELGNTKTTLIVTRKRKQSAFGVKDIQLAPLKSHWRRDKPKKKERFDED